MNEFLARNGLIALDSSSIFGPLTVSGSIRLSGSLRSTGDTLLIGSGNTSATNALLVQNSDGVNILRVGNDRTVTIGLAGGAVVVNTNSVTLDRTTFQVVRDGVNPNFFVSNIFGSNASGIFNVISTPTNYQPTTGNAVYNTFVVNPTVSQSNASGITRGIYVNPTLTSAWDFRAIEWTNNASSTSGSWGLYGVGSAPNYLSGSLSIGTTGSTTPLYVRSNAAVSSVLTLEAGSSQIAFSFNGSRSGFTYAGNHGVFFSPIFGFTGNNNVQIGIGNGDAAARLHVRGESASTGTALLIQNSTPSNLLTVLNNGNVGIAVSSPSEVLQIKGNLRVQTVSAPDSAGTASIILNPEVNTPATIQALSNFGPTSGTNYSTGFKFITSNRDASLPNPYYNVDAMSILANGNIGIGTTTDTSAKLHISGSTGALLRVDSNSSSNMLLVSSSGLVSVGNLLLVSSSVVSIGLVGSAYGSTGTSNGKLTINNNVGGNNGLAIRNGETGYQFAIKTTVDDNVGTQFTWYDGGTYTFLQYAGNIGTRLGSATIAQFRSNSDSSATIHTGGSTSERLRVTSTGLVGIGTTSPTETLDVRGNVLVSGSVNIRINQPNSNAVTYLSLLNDASGYVGYLFRKTSTNNLSLFGNYTTPPVMTWAYLDGNSSRVGINTLSPVQALHVSGNIVATDNIGVNNTSPTYRLDVNGSFRSSGSIAATSGSDYFDISHDITQPAQTGSQVYEVNITPTLRYTAPNQTQTALRVAATFSGSTALSSSQSNIIADFGSTSAGSQLVVNDITSGSIYMVNDVSGLPIIEANSNWDVFIYDYPNVVLKKTGSVIEVSGSLRLNGSSLDTAWTSYTPQWTAAITNPVLNNGTITGAYKLIGKTCFVRARLVIGSTTTLGSGQWYFSLPFSASIAYGIQFPCSMLDNGNAWYQGTVNGEYGGFTDKTAIIAQSSGSNSSQGVESNFPIAWGTSDTIQFNGSYEIA